MTFDYKHDRDAVESRDATIQRVIETFHGLAGGPEAEVTWTLPKGENPRMYGTTAAVTRLLKRVDPGAVLRILGTEQGVTIHLRPDAVRAPETLAKVQRG